MGVYALQLGRKRVRTNPVGCHGRGGDRTPEIRDLGPNIAAARRGRRLSQAELASRCGLSPAQVSYFELGRRRPTLDQALRLAHALACSVQRLLIGANQQGEIPIASRSNTASGSSPMPDSVCVWAAKIALGSRR